MKRPLHPRAIELRQVDASRGRARRYHVSECRSLFGERALLITWGRIGRPPRLRLETFRSRAALAARWQELMARRAAHGYRVHVQPQGRAHPRGSACPEGERLPQKCAPTAMPSAKSSTRTM